MGPGVGRWTRNAACTTRFAWPNSLHRQLFLTLTHLPPLTCPLAPTPAGLPAGLHPAAAHASRHRRPGYAAAVRGRADRGAAARAAGGRGLCGWAGGGERRKAAVMRQLGK